MKKILCTLGIIFSVFIIGIIAINVYETNSSKKQITKVGVIFNGVVTDKSWTQSHYEGIMKTADTLELDVVYRENVGDEESFGIIEEMIDDGSKIIICTSFGFGDSIQKAAEKYPDVCFFHASGIKNSKNLTTYYGRMYQIRYLSGIVAGIETKNDKIGYVAAFPNSEVNRGINAFTLGVRSVNSDANVYVEWCESWTDDELAEKAARKLIDDCETDVMAMHVDSLKPLDVAVEKGVKVIGNNRDNSHDYPENYLTSTVWEWGNFYTPYINKYLQGKLKGHNYWGDVGSGIVSLAPLTGNADKETQKIVNEKFELMKSGTFDVFYGPVRDSNGSIRINDGENMSDYSMLNEFDWYVEGVINNDE